MRGHLGHVLGYPHRPNSVRCNCGILDASPLAPKFLGPQISKPLQDWVSVYSPGNLRWPPFGMATVRGICVPRPQYPQYLPHIACELSSSLLALPRNQGRRLPGAARAACSLRWPLAPPFLGRHREARPDRCGLRPGPRHLPLTSRRESDAQRAGQVVSLSAGTVGIAKPGLEVPTLAGRDLAGGRVGGCGCD